MRGQNNRQQVGLGHTNQFGVMLPTGANPIAGGIGTAEPFADDALGEVSLYRVTPGTRNILASAE